MLQMAANGGGACPVVFGPWRRVIGLRLASLVRTKRARGGRRERLNVRGPALLAVAVSPPCSMPPPRYQPAIASNSVIYTAFTISLASLTEVSPLNPLNPLRSLSGRRHQYARTAHGPSFLPWPDPPSLKILSLLFFSFPPSLFSLFVLRSFPLELSPSSPKPTIRTTHSPCHPVLSSSTHHAIITTLS